MKKIVITAAALALISQGAIASPLSRSTVVSETGETQTTSDGGVLQFLLKGAQTSIVLLMSKVTDVDKTADDKTCERSASDAAEADGGEAHDDDMDGPEPVYFAF